MTDIERLQRLYFSDPVRRRQLAAGEVLLEQHAANHRLYLLLSGRVEGQYQGGPEEEWLPILTVEPGNFMGVHSFFSRSYVSYCRLQALEPCDIAWIDCDIQPQETEQYGSLTEQFMPVIMEELKQRQLKINRAYLEQVRIERQLLKAETMSTLGELAAGVAHELNNAIGVVTRTSSYLTDYMGRWLAKLHPEGERLFRQGLEGAPLRSTADLRAQARQLQTEFKLSPDKARQFARILNGEPASRARLAELEAGAEFWDLGRDCHDMILASRHAASIVRSVKQLGAGAGERRPGVYLVETIEQALTLLKSSLRRVNVELSMSALPAIPANETEWVQVWVNIIKNACDALQEQSEPRIWIRSRCLPTELEIVVGNNGPAIPPALLARIFEPHFTTKRQGHAFGLGLGLAIVKRLVESYGGSLSVNSQATETQFCVRIPIDHGQTLFDLRG